MGNREEFGRVTESEQHGQGIERGIETPYVDVRKSFEEKVRREYRDILSGFTGKDEEATLDKLIGQEFKRWADEKRTGGTFEDLREETMVTHWKELEDAYQEHRDPFNPSKARMKVESVLNNLVELEKQRRAFHQEKQTRDDEAEQHRVAEWMTRRGAEGKPIPDTYEERLEAMRAEASQEKGAA